MKYAAVVLLLAASLFGQALPDAPSEKMEPKKGVWDDSVLPGPNITWRHVFTDKRFLIPHLVMIGSVVFDAEITHAGIAHHKCVEGNTSLDRHPSRSELYVNSMIPALALTGLDALMRKGKLPFYIYDGAPVYGTIIHMKAGSSWLGHCW